MLCSSSSGVPCHRRASTSPRAAEAEATADRPSSSGRSLFLASNSLSNCGRKSLVSLLRAPTHLLNSTSHLPAKVHLLLNGLLEVRHPVLEPSHAGTEVSDQSGNSSKLQQKRVISWSSRAPPSSCSEPATPSSGLSMSWPLLAWSLGSALTLKAG